VVEVHARTSPRDVAGELATAALEAATAARDVAARDSDAALATAAAAEPPIALARPGPADGLLVRVIDARTGEPAAAAQVALLVTSDDHQSPPPPPLYLADEHGELRVPWPDSSSSTRLECVEPGRAGAKAIDSCTPPGAILRLHPRSAVTVRVLDAEGAPVPDVAVAFARRGSFRNVSFCAAATTGEDGCAHLDGIERRNRGGSDDGWGVGPVDWIGDAPFVPLDPERLPETPVDLRLPRHVRVSFRVVDDSGATIDLLDVVSVRELGREGCTSDDYHRPLERGVTRALLVSLECRFRALWWQSTSYAERTFGPLDGAQAEVTFDLDSAMRDSRFRLRAVDSDGRPIARARFCWQAWSIHGTAASDDEGAFVLGSRDLFDVDATEVVITQRGEKGGQPWMRRGAVPRPERIDRDADLGDVELVDVPLYVAGRVVDDLGAPVSGAAIDVIDEEFQRWRDPIQEELYPQDRRTDDAGRFSCFVAGEYGPRTVAISRDGYGTSEHLSFARGERDLTVVLFRCGRLAGHVRSDDVLAQGSLEFALEREDGSAAPGESVGHQLEESVFFFRRPPPGVWTLVVRPRRADWESEPRAPLVKIPGVKIEPARLSSDPRLEPIDLRGRVTPIRLAVTDSRGVPVPDCIAWMSGHGEFVDLERSELPPCGRGDFLTVDASATIEVAAPGFRRVVRENASGDVAVTLQRSEPIPLVVSVADRETLARAQADGCVRLEVARAGEPRHLALPWHRTMMDAEGRANLELDEPGVYDLHMTLYRNGVGEFRRLRMRTVDATRGAPPEVVLSLDEKE
jgi:hypothetical protein